MSAGGQWAESGNSWSLVLGRGLGRMGTEGSVGQPMGGFLCGRGHYLLANQFLGAGSLPYPTPPRPAGRDNGPDKGVWGDWDAHKWCRYLVRLIYASVKEIRSRGPMLIEAMTEVEKMDLRLTARGPASAKCESCVLCPDVVARDERSVIVYKPLKF
ncbi:hypothetical protein E2C01_019794 [Portunus trituberculatus]|uniref:Uncharacterized protein n=1 Tax=Portunus trituberculatus TaxID=210409 RepID=A0A5B7DYW8_PORTR|nr:hypothetical protein [Portunus trituberculatus]